MDFLKNKFNNYYYNKEQIKDMYKIKGDRVILYISSFVMANITNNLKNYLENRTGMNIDENVKVAYESKIETLKWFEKLLKSNTNTTIIYRPHPAENNDDYLYKLEKKYENFKVINDFSVKQWIKVSDDVFTWFSTSIVEAYFANKNCGIIRPIKIEEELDAVIYKGAKIIDNYSDFEEYLKGNYKTGISIDERLIQDYYDVTDIPSYIRISNILEEVLETNKYDLPQKVKYRINLKDILKPIIKHIIVNFKIADKPGLFKYNSRAKKWLLSFKEHRIRCEKDIASIEEINLISTKIKDVLIEFDSHCPNVNNYLKK